jgi:hypothetical protein
MSVAALKEMIKNVIKMVRPKRNFERKIQNSSMTFNSLPVD